MLPGPCVYAVEPLGVEGRSGNDLQPDSHPGSKALVKSVQQIFNERIGMFDQD